MTPPLTQLTRVPPAQLFSHFQPPNIIFLYPWYRPHTHNSVMGNLVIRQQRRPLTVLIDNLASWEGITAKKTRNTHRKRDDEEQGTDGEGEDPLELEEMRLSCDLADTSRCGMN